MKFLKALWEKVVLFFSEEEDPNEPVYDPAHIAGVIVLAVVVIGVLFWLLWTLLVFGGGLFGKIVPFLQVAFTKKTLSDFGWVGYPYELGVFEGFVANLIALALTIALIYGLWRLFQEPPSKGEKTNDESPPQ